MSTAATNPAVTLARYTADVGDRLIQGQRILGVVRLTDIPATGHGRRFLIERELETRDEVAALVADYLQRARALHAIPADPAALRLGAVS